RLCRARSLPPRAAAPHSAPTRRSSDLADIDPAGHLDPGELRGWQRGHVRALAEVRHDLVARPADVAADLVDLLLGQLVLLLGGGDRKSTRLNSSHVKISYAVFCLQKKT